MAHSKVVHSAFFQLSNKLLSFEDHNDGFLELAVLEHVRSSTVSWRLMIVVLLIKPAATKDQTISLDPRHFYKHRCCNVWVIKILGAWRYIHAFEWVGCFQQSLCQEAYMFALWTGEGQTTEVNTVGPPAGMCSPWKPSRSPCAWLLGHLCPL